MTDTEVVVTGLGAVSGWGWGMERLWHGLLGGGTAIRPLDRFPADGHRTTLAAQVAADGEPELPGVSGVAPLSDRFAIAAAREAVAAAGLDVGLSDAGVFFGSSTGAMYEAELYYERWLDETRREPSVRLLTSQQYNGPGDAVARDLRCCGPVQTLSSACTSSALAIGAARRAIVDGEIRVALAGGSDSLCQLTYAGFNCLRSVDEAPSRPFSGDRAGLSLGEGAAVLMLERADDAAARGAPVLAWLAGCGSSCDAHHMTAPQPTGAGAAAAIREALAEAGCGTAEVGMVNAHGTGTPLNDVAEWRALVEVFGDRAVSLPITAPKASVGHLLGAAGALEAAVTVRCLTAGLVPPCAGAVVADPEIPAQIVRDRPLPLPGLRWALSTNLAFGGSNAALLFHRR